MNPECDSSDLTLRERMARVEAHLETSKESVRVAAETLTDRLLHSNGLIEQMRGQAVEFARKGEIQALERRIEILERTASNTEGRRSGSEPMQKIGMAIVLALVAGVVALFFAALKMKGT